MTEEKPEYKVSESNTAIWDKLRTPPKQALKKITGGRLRGMTDISPQWRFQVMTETFGPVGKGWKYVIDRVWFEVMLEEVLAFAEVSIYYRKSNGEWSEPIPGTGGSKLVTKEDKGFHISDEGYKMAVTDALSVAMKALGVGADIYLGIHDGSKYSTTEKKPTEKPTIHTKPAKFEIPVDFEENYDILLKQLNSLGDYEDAMEWAMDNSNTITEMLGGKGSQALEIFRTYTSNYLASLNGDK